MSEEAKATGEVAKTVGKAIDVSEKAGRFIAKLVSGSLEQAAGIFEDKLKYMRWERQIRLMKKAEEFMKEAGLKEPTRAVPLKFAIPLLQGASLEDDDDLQDLWAKLLVNSANRESGISLKRAYIDILERISPLEARILKVIYSLNFLKMQHQKVITSELPERARIPSEDEKRMKPVPPNEEVELALANLSRLGCLSPTRSLGGGELFGTINPTVMGKRFVEACTLQRIGKRQPERNGSIL